MPRGMKSKFFFGKLDYNISQNQRLQFTGAFTRQVETTSWNFSLTTRSRWFQLDPDDYIFAGKWQMNSSDGHKLQELKVSYYPRFYFVDSPLENGSLATMRCRNSTLVCGPTTSQARNARLIRASASARVAPCTISLAIIGS